jgi:CheY-like chemotaxis protein
MPAAQGCKGTALYVEDEENDVILMRLAFERAGLGAGLHVLASGPAAIEYLSGSGVYADRTEHPVPELILLDLSLPALTGMEVLRWIRAQPSYRETPVVIFSSSCREQDRQIARQLGANDFLEKPTSLGSLGAVVQRLKEQWLERR